MARSGGVHFLFIDGGVRFVSEGVDPEAYKGFSMIAGGEVASAL